jgi:hypothetical protein
VGVLHRPSNSHRRQLLGGLWGVFETIVGPEPGVFWTDVGMVSVFNKEIR